MLRKMCKVMGCRRFLNNFGRGYFRRLVGVAFNPFLRELKLGLLHLRLRQQCIFESLIEVYTCTPMVADFLRIWLSGTSHKLFDAFCIAAFVWLSQRLRRPCRCRRGARQRYMRFPCFGTDARPVEAARLFRNASYLIDCQ